MKLRKQFRHLALATGALLFLAAGKAFADVGEITRSFSGIWDQPDHESQGFIITIGENQTLGKVGVVYWVTYGSDLESAWYVAIGPVVGNEIQALLYKSSGVTFLEGDIETNANVEEIGTLVLSFRNCNQGTAAFDTPESELGSGEVRIKRLTSVYNMRCSGGISDDTPGDAKPLQLEVDLFPVEESDEGEGKAKFWERPGRSDLKVTVDDLLLDGTYELKICDTGRGTFTVEEGEGNIQFRSPANPAKIPLNFDPRGCRFDVLLDGTVVLTSGEAVLAPKSSDDDDDEEEGDNDFEIEIGLDSTGVIAGARGSAKYEADDEEVEFEVKIRNVPVGVYRLYVGDDWVGDIEVEEGPGNSPARGEISFSSPVEDDDLPLNFDPLAPDATIRVTDDEDVTILTGEFPTD